MDLTSIKTIKNLLNQHGLRPSKRLGQNFLVDREAIGKIIEVGELTPKDTVLEIGPGLGVLTQEIAKKVKKVIAVEKDQNMVNMLKETLRDFDNIEVVQSDILKFDFSNFGFRAFKVVANLPYYITAPTVRKFLEAPIQPKLMVLVVQKEVGQRICPACRQAGAKPKMNLLAVSVQFYAEPKIISYINKDCFWPQPDVDAAIIKITPKPQGTQTPDVCIFFKIAKAGFSHPRKQLINNLSKDLKIDKKKVEEWLLTNNIQPSQRAETLAVDDWINLTKNYKMEP